MMVGMWTLDELVERVRMALSAEYSGAPNGRVRDLPDRRAIRWYATIGLVDRPAAMRGRVALYAPRHLLQVVALKRLQAEGRSLAEIQAELAGAGDGTLSAVARIPANLLDDAPIPAPAAPAAPSPAAAQPPAAAPALAPAPAAREKAASSPPAVEVARPRFWTAAAAFDQGHGRAATADPIAALPAGAVALRGGAILVLPVTPAPGDYADIAAAAAPLLDLLAARGLLTSGHPSPTAHADDGSAR
jgi:DNA-binding transcriptional MerR regulator